MPTGAARERLLLLNVIWSTKMNAGEEVNALDIHSQITHGSESIDCFKCIQEVPVTREDYQNETLNFNPNDA